MSKDVKKVLVVDDHPAFRASARRLLESEGYAVVGEAGDGAGALTAVRELVPDLVLLDVQLPDIDGFEIAERINASANDHGPGIVLVSSRDRTDFGPLLDGAAVLGFISKAELTGEALSELLR
ncbi:MAG: response regulator transcription factor [Thermoleophilaceae bacterium]|nr:response regulator transcription factor [Thermoleophilaceae bacterium]